jgi:hypothetical protein
VKVSGEYEGEIKTRTKATPSLIYAFFNPSNSLSFLIDIKYSTRFGASVYRKCVNINEIAYDVVGGIIN